MYTPLFKIKKVIFLLDLTVIYDIKGLMLTFIRNPGATCSFPFFLSPFYPELGTWVSVFRKII